jgi:hypothetical protein
MLFGVNAKRKSPRSASSEVTTSIKPKPAHPGRERLQQFAKAIGEAHQAIESLQETIARLGAVVAEAAVAQRELQTFIAKDSGIALTEHSAGRTKATDEISRLVAHAKSSGDAAAAAKDALPTAEEALANARSQLLALEEHKHAELRRVMANLADVEGRAYQAAFDQLCLIHDRLVGYCAVAENTVGEIRLVHAPLETPRFALPSAGDANADQFIRRSSPSELTVNESARKWSAIRSRLEADANADVSDLN